MVRFKYVKIVSKRYRIFDLKFIKLTQHITWVKVFFFNLRGLKMIINGIALN